MKRQITPHKGDRRARIEARVTLTTRNQLTAILDALNADGNKDVSIADWLTMRIAEEYAKLQKRDAISTKNDAINA